MQKLTCDYLVVGAGAASLAFIDTLLIELPEAKVILVDKHEAPGGHWIDAYDFVRLHQPSLLYGVSSKQMEGNWLYCLLKGFTLPWNHRATKAQILSYFKSLVNGWVGKGMMEYYSLCKYDFHAKKDDIHSFSSLDGKVKFTVKVKVKLVNATLMEPIIPSLHPVTFPVEEGITISSPNDVFHMKNINTWFRNNERRFLVMGCGKTGVDTICYLQREKGVDPDHITWIIPNDVWYLKRGNGGGMPSDYGRTLLEFDGDKDKSSLALEERGIFLRLDENIMPTRFRFPVVGIEELVLMRKVRNVIRRGRVTSISLQKNYAVNNKSHDILVQFDSEQSSLILSSTNENIIVNCTCPGPFNGINPKDIFVSNNEMNLLTIFAPPVTLSVSCLGLLEAARMKGTLNLDFARNLFAAESKIKTVESPKISENEILKRIFRPINRNSLTSKTEFFDSIRLLGVFLALANHDSKFSFDWMKGNRLSILHYPVGAKAHIYEDLQTILEKKKVLELSIEEERGIELLCNKLACLEGK